MGNAPLETQSPRAPQAPEEKEENLDYFDRGCFAQERTGSLFKRYEMLEEVGTGNFGVVNRGRDLRTSVSVAIKTLSKDKIQDNEKAKVEFKILRHLDHANICKVCEAKVSRRISTIRAAWMLIC